MPDSFFEGRIHLITDAARISSSPQVFLAWPHARETCTLNPMDQGEKVVRETSVPYDVLGFVARLENELGPAKGRLAALARVCGIKHAAVQGWLKGSIPRSQYWHHIENFLGCSMAYLLFGIKGAVMPSDKSLDRQAAIVIIEAMERHVSVLKTIVRKPAATLKRNPPGSPPRKKS